MKSMIQFRFALLGLFLMATFSVMAQKNSSSEPVKTSNMKTYLIERDIPGAGAFTAEQLKNISITSCGVLDKMGPQIKWLQSYVVDDKIFCVYQAENEDLIREHGKNGGFPVTKIMEIENTISPATAKGN
ncbi:MAG: DUF4242 domain-containing protein [Saprospiraceae bacterium]